MKDVKEMTMSQLHAVLLTIDGKGCAAKTEALFELIERSNRELIEGGPALDKIRRKITGMSSAGARDILLIEGGEGIAVKKKAIRALNINHQRLLAAQHDTVRSLVKSLKYEREFSDDKDVNLENRDARIKELEQKIVDKKKDHRMEIGTAINERDKEIRLYKSNYHSSEDDNKRLGDEIKALREALENMTPDSQFFPEYHYDGMGCGLEDRNITDRYDAMQYGWDEATDKMLEFIKGYRDEALKKDEAKSD